MENPNKLDLTVLSPRQKAACFIVLGVFVATSVLFLIAESSKNAPRPLVKNASFEIYVVSAESTPNTKTEVYERGEEIYLITPAAIETSDIASVQISRKSSDNPSLDVSLTPGGATVLSKLTADSNGTRLAIVINGKVVSAPFVRSPLSNSVSISGSKTDWAETFDSLTKSGPPAKP